MSYAKWELQEVEMKEVSPFIDILSFVLRICWLHLNGKSDNYSFTGKIVTIQFVFGHKCLLLLSNSHYAASGWSHAIDSIWLANLYIIISVQIFVQYLQLISHCPCKQIASFIHGGATNHFSAYSITMDTIEYDLLHSKQLLSVFNARTEWWYALEVI